MSEQALSVSGVTIAYDKTDVVFGADFSVEAGEVFGLVGLNGAGKTTLIKTILGLHEARQGHITVFGAPHDALKARRQVVYLPERFEPPWFLNGMEFIKFSLSLYRQAFDEDKVYAAADKLALDRKALTRRVQTYSKGMRQKLGIIGTVLTGCQFIILDEPMSGLDPLARSLVKDMLMDIKAHDQTILICSHILADLDEICARLAVIDQGRVQFVGTPAALKKQVGQESLERAFLHFIQERKQVA